MWLFIGGTITGFAFAVVGIMIGYIFSKLNDQ